MRVLLCLVIWSAGYGLRAQQKLQVASGTIRFTSNAALELIRASSDQVHGIIDPATNQFAFLVPVRSFRGFNSELQREHFNDKYMESDKYAEGSFSGKIIEQVDFTRDGTYDVRAKGDLTIHGQKQTRIIKCEITIKDGLTSVSSHFTVPLSDHNIPIPEVVSQKIATEIVVDFNADMRAGQ